MVAADPATACPHRACLPGGHEQLQDVADAILSVTPAATGAYIHKTKATVSSSESYDADRERALWTWLEQVPRATDEVEPAPRDRTTVVVVGGGRSRPDQQTLIVCLFEYLT